MNSVVGCVSMATHEYYNHLHELYDNLHLITKS